MAFVKAALPPIIRNEPNPATYLLETCIQPNYSPADADSFIVGFVLCGALLLHMFEHISLGLLWLSRGVLVQGACESCCSFDIPTLHLRVSTLTCVMLWHMMSQSARAERTSESGRGLDTHGLCMFHRESGQLGYLLALL